MIVADYLALQEAEEREMEDMMEQMSTYKPFKTRKQLRWEKFGVDEDADEELMARINIPRRKDHEKGTDLEELTDRHKSLVTGEDIKETFSCKSYSLPALVDLVFSVFRNFDEIKRIQIISIKKTSSKDDQRKLHELKLQYRSTPMKNSLLT